VVTVAIFLEENGRRFPIASEEDHERVIRFLQKRFDILRSLPSFAEEDSGNTAEPQVATSRVANVGANVSEALRVVQAQKDNLQKIQAILDSGTNRKEPGTPPPGEQLIDYIERGLVSIGARKAEGRSATYAEATLATLGQGWRTDSKTADSAISTVRQIAQKPQYSHRVEASKGRITLLRPEPQEQGGEERSEAALEPEQQEQAEGDNPTLNPDGFGPEQPPEF
jgi:hypothetical protein